MKIYHLAFIVLGCMFFNLAIAADDLFAQKIYQQCAKFMPQTQGSNTNFIDLSNEEWHEWSAQQFYRDEAGFFDKTSWNPVGVCNFFNNTKPAIINTCNVYEEKNGNRLQFDCTNNLGIN